MARLKDASSVKRRFSLEPWKAIRFKRKFVQKILGEQLNGSPDGCAVRLIKMVTLNFMGTS